MVIKCNKDEQNHLVKNELNTIELNTIPTNTSTRINVCLRKREQLKQPITALVMSMFYLHSSEAPRPPITIQYVAERTVTKG